MNLHSHLKMTGKLSIKKYDKDLNLIEEIDIPNLIVNTGKSYVAERMISNTTDIMSNMAVGDGSGVVTVSDVGLVSEKARVILSSSSRTNTNITYTATFLAGVATGAINEAGIFNASTAGTMLCRTTFPVITKAVGDSIAISWTVTVG